MYINSIVDEIFLNYIENDLVDSEGIGVHRGDGLNVDLMADMFVGDHSREDIHYLYQIKKIKRNQDSIEVLGYGIRVKCPGRDGKKIGGISRGKFIYTFTDTAVSKTGNVLSNGNTNKNYIKFIYMNLPENKKVEFKRTYIRNLVAEAESFLNF